MKEIPRHYTNSSHLPVDYTSDIFDALDVQDELQTLYTSGTVFHAFLGEKTSGLEGGSHTGKKDCRKLSVCLIIPCHRLIRYVKNMVILRENISLVRPDGKKAEVYSRITGYYRPVQNWMNGKRRNTKNRTVYDILSLR